MSELSPEKLERLERLDELLVGQGFDLDDVDSRGVNRINFWQQGAKNPDGEYETHDLAGIELRGNGEQYIPDFRPDRARVSPTRRTGRIIRGLSDAAILPDMQMSWYRHYDGYEDDFGTTHDEDAIETCLQIIKDKQPSHIGMNGDNLDFPDLSDFKQERRFQGLLERNLEGTHDLMARIRANAPDAKIFWIEGNHEERLQRQIGRNIMQLMGVRRPKENSPVLSISHLLRLEELGIDYIEGYPSNPYWLNDITKVEHGNVVNSAGSTAARIAMRSLVNVSFGHVHRREYHSRQVELGNGETRTIVAASGGTLARTTGEVPSSGSSVDAVGRPQRHVENWTKGMQWIYFNQNNEQYFVNIDLQDNNTAIFEGKIYGNT